MSGWTVEGVLWALLPVAVLLIGYLVIGKDEP